MRLLGKVTVGLSISLVLALGLLVYAARSASRFVPQDGDPIIVKGGSLSVQCPANDLCLVFNPTTLKYEHKDKLKKITKIVVKDENNNVLFSATSASFPNGKPSVEITYK